MFARTTKRRAAATPGRASLSLSLSSADTPARPPKDLFSKDKLIHASEKCTAEKVSSFPKEIRDILRGSDTSNINGKFDSSGYGFLIIENIVHVWDVTSGMKTTKFSPPLSQKDLLPDLVTLIKMENKHGLAVCTSEGVVRVWASLLAPADYLDASLKINSSPTNISYCDGVGVVVGTVGGGTVHLYMVQLNPLSCRPFKAPSSSSSSSWFSYLTGSSKYPEVKAILPGPRRASHVELYVLTELTLQKWEIYGNTEKMQQEFPIRAWLKEELMRADNSDYVVNLQDAKFANESTLYVLARSYLAYCPADADRTLSHHIAVLRLGPPDEMLPFQHFEVPLSKPPLYDPLTYEFSSPRLAIPNFHNPSNTYAYICLEDTIVLLQGNTPEEIVFPGEKILALGTVKKSTYVVAQKTGCVKFNVIGQIETQAQSPPRQYSQQLVSSSSSASTKDLLAQAIKAHASGDKHKAFVLATQIGNELSEVAIQMSYSILDNAPFSESDPQWTDAANSMFIRSQVEAKKSKHIDLVNFLKDQYNGLSLWVNLIPIAQSSIEENGEKLVAALNLRTTQTSEGDVNRESLIQRAIKRVLDERKVEHVRSAITAQEIYYSKVSVMDEIVGVVYDRLLMMKPSTSLQAHDQASIAEFFEANRIYLAFFSALSPATMAAQRTHFHTRQLALKNLGHKYLLLAREFLRLELGEHEKELYQQIFNLTRSVLASFAYETEANPNGSTRVQYFQVREELLRTFLPGHKDLAIRLAEEFEDFHILMLVCTERQDKQRVYDYMHRFSKQGFPEFVFETFHKTHRYDELMSVPSEFSEQLMNYLRPYPSLAWLQFIHCQKYADASNALRLANEEEKESLGRKKVLLSLAKLSNLANSVSAPVDRRLEQQMYMLRLQKTILPNQTKPLEPKELAQSILYHSHAPVIQNVLSALDAAKNSDALLPSEERQQLIEIVWYFALEHGFEWNAVISDWKNGKIEDKALRQAIEASVIYGAAVHPNNIGLFPASSMVTVFTEFLQRMSQARTDEDPQLLARLLKAFHDVILPLPACHPNIQ